MYTALAGVGATTASSSSVASYLILIALLVIGWPLFRKLRRSISASRKRRWAREGLMDLPDDNPVPGDQSESGERSQSGDSSQSGDRSPSGDRSA